MEDKMCYTLNPHRNSKAKEDRLDSSLASGLLCSCLVIGRSPSVLVAVQLPEDHSCCRNNRKQERKHTLSLESKNVFADTNTRDFSGSLPGRMFFVLVVQISTVLCVQRVRAKFISLCVCVCGGGYHYWTKGQKYRPKHTRFCVSISVNVTFVVASENQSHNFQDFLHKILCFGSFSNTQATVQSCC